jgi:hypothetical protein
MELNELLDLANDTFISLIEAPEFDALTPDERTTFCHLLAGSLTTYANDATTF